MAYCLEGTTLHLFQLSLITCRREAGRTVHASSQKDWGRTAAARCNTHPLISVSGICAAVAPPCLDGAIGLPKVGADLPPLHCLEFQLQDPGVEHLYQGQALPP